MRLSQVLVLIAASFLVASEAHSTTTESNQVKLSEVASPSGPNQRLLRTHQQIVEDEDDSSEERTFTPTQLEKLERYATKLGINWERAQRDTQYLQAHARYSEYQKKANRYIKRNKQPVSPRITYSENY
ncbi:hypothetical protein PF010_g13231 [Phytophthora fragariae]|uniref:RxLR effector protein n=1 Tax=Phytophthora fragariae TaxID=53985 RepID=A0A6A3K673_9STRA|nr:hypothetical protein PF011_g14281 [Phytophthora fragariae]KAE9104858.1 hypothetical protein PF010_g13231 [Phytophthora fragariae]KAE9211623.1 hypothetical protein PF004_g15871 [Phytophthora fragariae]